MEERGGGKNVCFFDNRSNRKATMSFDLFHRNSSYVLTRQDGLTVSLQQALRTKRYVILFLAGQWWAPCRGVAAQLCSFYSSLHDTFNFEVIFLSTDRSETTMLDFFHSSHGDWLCLNYNDARHLEAALAGDKELHPKQVPACLVFELEDGSSRADDTRNGQANGAAADTSTFSSSSSARASTSPHSFARLITKHGREMLSRDKEGALFPWYDDGWDDAAAQQRSALLRKSSMEQTSTLASTRMPPPETPSAEPEGARCVEDSESKAAHNGLAPRTNPHPTLPHPSLPSTDAASAATPSTPLVTKHQPATVAQTEGHEVDAAATQDEDEEGEGAHEKDEKMREDVGPKHASDAVEGSAAAVEAGAAGNGTPEEEDAPSSTRHDETAPESRRQLTYSQSPDSRDEVKREPRLSRVIVMDREFAASICTAQVEVETKNREAGEGDRDGDGEREAEEEAGVRPHEMLETHISTVTKVFSTNVSAATDEDKAEGAATAAIVFAAVVEAEAGADGEDDKTLEFSAIDKSVPVSGDASVE